MSSEHSRNARHPLKPSLASTRTARTPVTPRVAVSAASSAKSPASSTTPSIRSEPPTPRARQVDTPVRDAVVNDNVTPRSSARASKAGSTNPSPTSSTRPKSVVVGSEDRASGGQPGRSKSFVAGNARVQSPLIRSPGLFGLPSPSVEAAGDAQFFHASDALKQETAPKKPEPQKKPQFLYADGKQEANDRSVDNASPVLSAISDQRSAGPWIRSDDRSRQPASPPILSPALSNISSTSPFFVANSAQAGKQPSPTQSKENIHLSYRKGVSQIIGVRPAAAARSAISNPTNSVIHEEPHPNSGVPLPGFGGHQRSPSLSSIDSGNSIQSRRKSSALLEPEELNPAIAKHRRPRLPDDLPSIDTSLQTPGVLSRTESGLSPTKAISEMAADARRERKVLDLEISNNSLLSINTALEREVRRQKAELKRFRRLSRAGRFSLTPGERMRTLSEDLTVLNEDDEELDEFGFPSGSVDADDFSDDDESIVSSADPLSAGAEDRLARDENRLRVDLEKHRELLVQSQAMNQSLKRCMYATEEMLQEGKKALEYQVRVSDVKLGGRVLSAEGGAEEHQEIEVEDDDLKQASGFLETWTNVKPPSLGGSEGGDRDSGVEVDGQPIQRLMSTDKLTSASEVRRPPGLGDTGRFMSFSHSLDDYRVEDVRSEGL